MIVFATGALKKVEAGAFPVRKATTKILLGMKFAKPALRANTQKSLAQPRA